MTIQYKNAGYNLNVTTAATTALVIDASSRAIVKEISIANSDNSAHDFDIILFDKSLNTSFIVFHANVSADSHDNGVHNSLVLEESDAILLKANQTNVFQGVISYALINRSQENG